MVASSRVEGYEFNTKKAIQESTIKDQKEFRVTTKTTDKIITINLIATNKSKSKVIRINTNRKPQRTLNKTTNREITAKEVKAMMKGKSVEIER